LGHHLTDLAFRLPVSKRASISNHFAVEQLFVLARRGEQKSIEAFEVALNVFGSDYLIDLIARGTMAFRGKIRSFPAEETFKFEVTSVERISEMSSRARSLTTADTSSIDHNYRLSF
jgi:hypothetical protein